MKTTILFLTICLSTSYIAAQNDPEQWRIGVYGGYNFYYGDLNNHLSPFQIRPFFFEKPLQLLSYGISAERKRQNLGVKLFASRGIFQANDRALNWQGWWLENPSFQRSLNAETRLWDASLMLSYYFSLPENTSLTPYFSVGFGYTNFNVFADLYDAQNRRYFYWSDGTIHYAHELTMPPNLTTTEQDGVFETDLTTLQTEQTDYPTWVWNVPVAVGLQFRLAARWQLQLELLARYAHSDFLDDVSGDYPTSFDTPLQAYASNPNDQTGKRGDNQTNDFYGLISVSLHYCLGKHTTDFSPPIFYTPNAESVAITNVPKIDSFISVENVPEISIENPELASISTIEEENSTPTLSNFTAERTELETLESLTQTRLEAAYLNKKLNDQLIAVQNIEPLSKDSIALIFNKLEELNLRLDEFEQYNIRFAVQANDHYTRPNNRKIQEKTSLLTEELTELRRKYRLMMEEPDTTNAFRLLRAAEKSRLDNIATDTKIKTLEEEIGASKENVTAVVVVVPLPAAVPPHDSMLKIEATPSRPDTVRDSVASVLDNHYDSTLQVLSKELELLKTVTLSQKTAENDSLRNRISFLVGQIEALKIANEKFAELLQKKVEALQHKVFELERQQQERPEPSVQIVEKMVETPPSLQTFVEQLGVTNVYFTTGSVAIQPEFKANLDKIVVLMAQHPSLSLSLKGFTDKSGNPNLNFQLSKRRTQTVQQYFIQKGILTERLDVSYFGEIPTAASNDPVARRVEIRLILK